MRKILVPVDHSAVSDNLIRFAAAMSGDFFIEEILLLKTYHVEGVARVLPSPDMLMMTPNEIAAVKQDAINRAEQLGDLLHRSLLRPVKIRTIVVDGTLEKALMSTMVAEGPDLLMIGSDPVRGEHEDTVSNVVVPLAKLSAVPVLLVPLNAHYRKPERLMVPTSFKNTDRLASFHEFFKSRTWRDVRIHIFHAGVADSDSSYDEQIKTIYGYLQGYRIKFYFRECVKQDIAQEILKFAEEEDIDMIFALPGKHGFFQQFLHKSVTRTFALFSDRPVMLLK